MFLSQRVVATCRLPWYFVVVQRRVGRGASPWPSFVRPQPEDQEGKFPDFTPRTIFNTEDANMKERENVNPPQGKATSSGVDSNDRTMHNETVQPCDNVGYAVAIYPYTAEQEDEFDVAM